jgi:hypothetical protein
MACPQYRVQSAIYLVDSAKQGSGHSSSQSRWSQKKRGSDIAAPFLYQKRRFNCFLAEVCGFALDSISHRRWPGLQLEDPL